MKKIMLVSNSLESMFNFRYTLMETLISRGYELIIVAPEDKFISQISNMNCQYIPLNIDNKGSNPIKDIYLIYLICKIYININPDLIIHYTIKPNIYGSFAAKIANKKSLSIIPGLGYTFINENITSKIAKILYKQALKIPLETWFLNNDDKAKFINENLIIENRAKVIPGEGVNINKFKQLHNNKPTKIIFLMIARILKDKGVYEYVEAANIIQNKYKNIEFQLLGTLDAKNPTAIQKSEVDRWVKDSIINYLGTTEDVRPIIANSSCVVLPSYREGLSMSLMESASMSRPLIASNITGCKEVINNNITGYLCEVKNSQDLASKMENIINLSEEESLEMGKKGREKMVKEFDENIVVDQYLKSINYFLNEIL